MLSRWDIFLSEESHIPNKNLNWAIKGRPMYQKVLRTDFCSPMYYYGASVV